MKSTPLTRPVESWLKEPPNSGAGITSSRYSSSVTFWLQATIDQFSPEIPARRLMVRAGCDQRYCYPYRWWAGRVAASRLGFRRTQGITTNGRTGTIGKQVLLQIIVGTDDGQGASSKLIHLSSVNSLVIIRERVKNRVVTLFRLKIECW